MRHSQRGAGAGRAGSSLESPIVDSARRRNVSSQPRRRHGIGHLAARPPSGSCQASNNGGCEQGAARCRGQLCGSCGERGVFGYMSEGAFRYAASEDEDRRMNARRASPVSRRPHAGQLGYQLHPIAASRSLQIRGGGARGNGCFHTSSPPRGTTSRLARTSCGRRQVPSHPFRLRGTRELRPAFPSRCTCGGRG